jgi:hypothetical protein
VPYSEDRDVLAEFPYLREKCACGHHPLAHYEPAYIWDLKHAGCLVARCKCRKSEEEAYLCVENM